ncbi:MAG: ECF-type sigma factor [Candidatus Eisenbacteria bacterium]
MNRDLRVTEPPSEERDGRLTGEIVGEITRELDSLRRNEPGSLDRLVGLLYEELRRLARQRLRGERAGHTLDTTALVHEAYLRLFREPSIDVATRADFFAVASNTMWRVLVDYARARARQKRGGGEQPIPLEEVEPFLSDRAAAEVLDLDEALQRLRSMQPRAAAVVEMHFVGGLTMEEIATHLGVSTKTVQRDWQAARAWLRKEVSGAILP